MYETGHTKFKRATSRERREEIDRLVNTLGSHVGLELHADHYSYGGWVLVASDSSKPFGARRRGRESFIEIIEFAIDACKLKEQGNA